jgi:hypothetical protein
MSAAFQTNSEPRISTLVSGIVADGQELLKQQLALFKCEIRQDLRRLKHAVIFLAIGCVLVLPAAVLLCVMLVQLLNWLWPALPLWGCYAIVGGVALLAASACLLVGAKLLAALNPAAGESLSALKENLRWLRNPS